MRIIKRVRALVTHVVNPPATTSSRSPQTPGVAVENHATGTLLSHAAAALRVLLAPIHAASRQAPGLRVESRVAGAPALATKTAGLHVATRLEAVQGHRLEAGVSTTPEVSGVVASDTRGGLVVDQRAGGTPAMAAQSLGLSIDRASATGTPARPTKTPGINILRSALTAVLAKPPQTAGVVVNRATATGAAKSAQVAGPRVSNTATATLKPRQGPSARIVRTSVVLVHTSGANANSTTGSPTWTNPSNAQGKKDGTLASVAGSATQPLNASLILDYANFANKSALTITKVLLRYFVRQAGTAANNGVLNLTYRLDPGAAYTTLETITSDVDALTTPREFDITSAVGGDWTKLDALQTRVNFQSGITELQTADTDAVHVYIEAESVVNL